MKTRFLPFAILLFTLCWNYSQAQWETTATGIFPTNYRVWSIKMTDANTIWAMTAYDAFPPPTAHSPVIFRSADGGVTWHSSSVPNTAGGYGWDVAGIDSLNAFAALDIKGLHWTQNGGTSWEKHPVSDSIPTAYAVHFFNQNEGWFFGVKPGNIPAVAITTDGGDTWTVVPPANLPEYNPADCFLCFNFANNSGYDVVGDLSVISSSNGFYWQSADKGLHWKRVETPFASEDYALMSIAVKDTSTVMIASNTRFSTGATVGTLAYTTTDNWQTWQVSYPGVTPACARFIPDTDSVLIMVAHTNYGGTWGTAISYDLGETWELEDNTRLISIDFLDKNTAVGALGKIVPWGSNGEVYRWDFELPSPIREVDANHPLQVSPNPATDFLNIQLPETTTAPLDVQVFDAQGRLILLANEQVLDVQGLAAGMYSLKVVVGDRVFAGKFVKQ
ncbi:MAG: T9SS type A sorting domain-containing protein [Saprospiraceae bacterium]|nr:T9SS type A sorting domain-containing protein [Saprospiraceae bacterium]